MGKIYARMNCICIAMSNIIKWWRNFGNNGVLTGYGGIASKSALLRMEGHKVLEQKDYVASMEGVY
jgi:hypothetical protein